MLTKSSDKTDSAVINGDQAKIHLMPDCQTERFVSYLHVAYIPPVCIIASAFWVTKVIFILSQYVVIIVFPYQILLYEHNCHVLHTYIDSLV